MKISGTAALDPITEFYREEDGGNNEGNPMPVKIAGHKCIEYTLFAQDANGEFVPATASLALDRMPTESEQRELAAEIAQHLIHASVLNNTFDGLDLSGYTFEVWMLPDIELTGDELAPAKPRLNRDGTLCEKRLLFWGAVAKFVLRFTIELIAKKIQKNHDKKQRDEERREREEGIRDGTWPPRHPGPDVDF